MDSKLERFEEIRFASEGRPDSGVAIAARYNRPFLAKWYCGRHLGLLPPPNDHYGTLYFWAPAGKPATCPICGGSGSPCSEGA